MFILTAITKKMKEEVEKLLPLIKSGQLSETEIQDLTNRIRLAIKEEPAKGKELGALFGKIKEATIAKPLPTGITWVAVDNGFLGIGHKPGGKISFEGLEHENTAAVLTLLHENEGAQPIGKKVANAGMQWIWFPFSASKPHEAKALDEVHRLYKILSDLLQAGKQIYIHCSAGIHRTGMITYGLLRYLGKDQTAARELLQSLRTVTAYQVGDDRLVWGDQFERTIT